MANLIERGGIYVAHDVKSGSSTRGDWAFIKVNNDQGKDPVTIWIDSSCMPCTIAVNTSFKVDEIVSYTQKKRKLESNGQVSWIQSDSISCKVSPVESTFVGSDPFNMGTNPFEANDPFKNAGNPFDSVKPEDDGELPF